jgi:enoyl-CoA hydratase/carnithine racemase
MNILTMVNGGQQNGLTVDVLDEYLALFDEIEASTGPAALVWTSDDPKYWCTGMNLKWVMEHMDLAEELKKKASTVFVRAALLNLPTVACITGHCYAGGALLAAGCDFRFMRKDKGRICVSEIDVNIPFEGSMHDVFELYPNAQARKEMLLTGKAYGGEEAEKLGIIDYTYSKEDLFPKALQMAEELSKKGRQTYASMKRGMRKGLLAYI